MNTTRSESDPDRRQIGLALFPLMLGIVVLVLAMITGVVFGRLVVEFRQVDDLAVARQRAEDHATESAILAYQRHLKQFPDDTTARLELAMNLSQKDPRGALAELRRIPAGTDEYLKAARFVAGLSLELERDYDAVAPLELLQNRFPNDAGVQLSLAEIFFHQRDFEKSLDHSRQLLNLKSDSIDACLLIAEASDSLGHTQEMIEPLEHALQLNPELAQAHLNLAYAYEAVGRPDAAVPHIHWFLERHPSSVVAYRTLAKIERSLGHYEEALSATEQGLKLVPINLEFSILRAEILLYLRRPEVAFDSLSELVSDRPNERRVLTIRLRAAILCGKTDQVKETQNRLRELDSHE